MKPGTKSSSEEGSTDDEGWVKILSTFVNTKKDSRFNENTEVYYQDDVSEG